MIKIRTKPELFIIESVDPDDEGNGRFEGIIISSILKLHGKLPRYRYVRTRGGFEEAVVVKKKLLPIDRAVAHMC